MCYDISFRVKLEQISDYFPNAVIDPQIKVPWPEYDHLQGPELLPKIPIVFNDKDGVLRCRVMQWGIIKPNTEFLPDNRDRAFGLNIMSEKVFSKWSDWYAIKTNRCLIPLTGTFEHRGILKWTKKVPYYIRPADQETFFMPGLYNEVDVIDRTTGELKKYWTWGMFTRQPSEDNIIRQIHNSSERGYRMALYLPLDYSKEYISKDLSDDNYKRIISYEMKNEQFLYYPTWTIRTTKPRPDGKPKYEPYEWPDLPPLGTMNPPLKKQLRMNYDEELIKEFEITFSYNGKEYNAFVEYRYPQFNLDRETDYNYSVYLDNPRRLFNYIKKDNGELEFDGNEEAEFAEVIKNAVIKNVQFE